MNTTHLAILILSVIDAGILLLAHSLDRQIYDLPLSNRMQITRSSVFLNMEFDEPVNRLLLSKGGTLVITIFFLTAIMVNLIH